MRSVPVFLLPVGNCILAARWSLAPGLEALRLDQAMQKPTNLRPLTTVCQNSNLAAVNGFRLSNSKGPDYISAGSTSAPNLSPTYSAHGSTLSVNATMSIPSDAPGALKTLFFISIMLTMREQGAGRTARAPCQPAAPSSAASASKFRTAPSQRAHTTSVRNLPPTMGPRLCRPPIRRRAAGPAASHRTSPPPSTAP
ncbi:hypothetical protein C8R47DRAFT_1110691 [Mycena vitilis]|nr:hypothetical protein C8R47DRAFT_1110691 [Mycena vitilis]